MNLLKMYNQASESLYLAKIVFQGLDDKIKNNIKGTVIDKYGKTTLSEFGGQYEFFDVVVSTYDTGQNGLVKITLYYFCSDKLDKQKRLLMEHEKAYIKERGYGGLHFNRFKKPLSIENIYEVDINDFFDGSLNLEI